MSILKETYRMNNGLTIPKLGFGTWQTPEGPEALNAVRAALDAGYTHIDTAASYENEASVGQAVRDSGISRDALFVTTKVPSWMKTYDEAVAVIQKSLRLLNVGRIDLLLIHAPIPWSTRHDPNADRCYQGNRDVWRAMEEAQARGEVISLGVSNFNIDDLDHLLPHIRILPTVNQIRLHPGYLQPELTAYCQGHRIIVEAYSPFATGKLLDDPRLTMIAQRVGKSVPQISLRYLLDKNLLPLPKSVHLEYIKANTELDFQLSAEDHKAIDALAEPATNG